MFLRYILIISVALGGISSAVLAQSQLFVINGSPTNASTSSVVLVQKYAGSGSSFLCSGTMLTKRIVLTAAHCVTRVASRMSVNVRGKLMEVRRVSIHPDLDTESSLVEVYNDIAIIKLKKGTKGATLPILISRDVESGDQVEIFGFGLDQFGRSGRLRTGESSVESVSSSHVVTYFTGSGSNTCNGDSGGPALLSYIDSFGVTRTGIVGVTSSGTTASCGVGDRTYFINTQTSPVLNFILSKAPRANVL